MSDAEMYDAELVDLAEPRPSADLAVVPAFDPNTWLPPEVLEDIAKGIPPNTRESYERVMEQFAAWCDRHGRRALPATWQTVAHYTSHLTRSTYTVGKGAKATRKRYKPSTLAHMLSAIRACHRYAGHQPPDTKPARKVIEGYRAELADARDPAAQTSHAHPADRTVLARVVADIDRSTLAGKRDAAVKLLGHDVASRGSDLVRLDWPGSFSPLLDDHTRVRIGYTVHIWRVKNREWQDIDIYYANDPNLCSAHAVEDLAAALTARGHPSGPLFRRITKSGRVAVQMTRNGKPIGDPDGRLTVDAVTDILKRNFKRAGEGGGPSSHSLRHGLVKTALDAGADPLDIKRHGNWNDDSTAFNRYVDQHDSRRRNPLKTISRAHATKA
ncbi:hypothetical protein LO772_29570 [Yinghuangia sp. ASG 101]|uniref:hypothetical protein n=1 Tax=Yinghuangia sp. ASG 101 TaxID=2896848 RepID=UPI001E55B0E3|nr:hypothetical protein [Yinghuangia sp. ASG 101]UGQ10921.1 hypothetical protein LO772_29570 [Yinghuangia sp. ASG 101]